MGCFRWIGQAVCFLLLLVLVPLALSGLWARATVLDQDRYVETVGPLASDRAVQSEITLRIMGFLDELVAEADVESPEAVQLLVSQYDEVRPVIDRAVRGVVESAAFETVWREANAAAHPVLMILLKGRDNSIIRNSGGVVSIDLAGVYDKVQSALEIQGVGLLNGIEPTDDQLTMLLFKSSDLVEARQIMRILDRGMIAIAALTIIVIFLYLWATPGMWRGIFWLAFVAVVTVIALYVGIQIGRDATAGNVANESSREAAEAIYDGVLKSLQHRMLQIGLSGTGVAGFLFLLSRFRPRRV